MVALPRLEDAPSIVAAELIRAAGMERTVVHIFIRVVPTVIVSITGPHSRNAFTILAVEFARIAGMILGSTHASLIDRLRRVVTLALCLPIQSRVAALRTTTIILQTRVSLTLLPAVAVHVYVPRRILQPFHHLDHIRPSMLLRSIDAPQLQICPVDVVPEDGDRKRIDGGGHENLPHFTI